MKKILHILILATVFHSCVTKDHDESLVAPIDTLYSVFADIETETVRSSSDFDAADDPAIWVHPGNPEKSVIIGSDKKLGIAVYDLRGKEKHFYEVGRINNIDVCYNFMLNGSRTDIVGGTNRTLNSVILYRINPENNSLENIQNDTVVSEVDEVYGFCFYKSKSSSLYYAFVNGKNGMVEQYLMQDSGGSVRLQKVRQFRLSGQVEGMVADYVTGNLFIGEEEKGIWIYPAEHSDTSPAEFLNLSDTINPNIVYDIEGLAIYYAGDKEGYLIASSQGNNSYAVFNKNSRQYMGSFRITGNVTDGVEETDGIDVTNMPLGTFNYGFFVVQDGFNLQDTVHVAQNFKLVSWQQIAKVFNPSLKVNSNFDIRHLF
ncbi:MAG: phytase [Bacteroidales bacterium]|nr:phytase [Bacteroidales bacterium]